MLPEGTKLGDNGRKLVHLFAGGIGATVGQCATCPLDVVQTRLQSSHLNFSNFSSVNAVVGNSSTVLQIHRPIFGVSYFQILYAYMKYMAHTEGLRALFKGLTPSLLGIVPAKSVYFFCYASVKAGLHQTQMLNGHQHIIHTVSAMLAGSVTGTVTNPVWYIKTKLQLNKKAKVGIYEVAKNGYKKHGIKCFFRGLSASYVGVLETVIYFLLYEDLKTTLQTGEKFSALNLVFAALVSKLTATVIMYPHEVIRTRLRQDVKDIDGRLKYRNFVQALLRVGKEDGRAGLYGGFGTSLIRQLPNTAIMFLTYEAIVHLLDKE